MHALRFSFGEFKTVFCGPGANFVEALLQPTLNGVHVLGTVAIVHILIHEHLNRYPNRPHHSNS